jgi:hypothetical protein
MKSSLYVGLLAFIITMSCCIALLMQDRQPEILVGCFMGFISLIQLTYLLMIILNEVTYVYRFLHFYWNTDSIKDVDTTIIKKLNNSEVTQLKKKWVNYNQTPILIDNVFKTSFDKEGRTRVTGWVQARNKAEAKRTLKYNQW